jgi:hypothetical protein
MPEDRDDDGKFKQVYTTDDFITAVINLNIASTQNVADRVGCSYNLAYRRLRELENDDELSCEEVGRSFVWFKD